MAHPAHAPADSVNDVIVANQTLEAQNWSRSVQLVKSMTDDMVHSSIEMLEMTNRITAKLDQLNGFVPEVTRVARNPSVLDLAIIDRLTRLGETTDGRLELDAIEAELGRVRLALLAETRTR
jgi:hypothetical protein